MAGLQDALADVAFKLESLKAALSDQQPGEPSQAANVVARVAADLQLLLQPAQQAPTAASKGAAAAQQQPVPAQQVAPAAEGAMPQAATLPATPFDQRRPPAAGPATAAKAPGPTPRGLPATTPLAAEVLASLNCLPPAGTDGSGDGSAAVAETDGDAEAAATLSGFLGGSLSLDPPSRAGSGPRQQHASPALASILGDGALVAPPPMHAAAMAAAAAAAAGPAVPVPRRASSAAAAALPIATQARNLRPCNCKRSMCLKMYCDCFAAGGYCAPSCTCLSCSNTPADFEAVQAAREVVLAKNPRAFEVKVTASEGHKRGCRCKRSKCLKKYCECFHAGARCNPDVCQCEDCRNTDGDTVLAPLLGLDQQSGPSWASMGLLDPTADVLAMFQAPLPPLPTTSNGSGSSGGSAGRMAQALPLPPLPGFALPPLPDASGMLGGLQLPLLDASAAAAFAINPVAAAAAATFAAAATMADTQQQQQQPEESMEDAASCPMALQTAAAAAALAAVTAGAGAAPAAPAGRAAATPAGQAKMASALTSHLSDMAGPDAEMHDTATSPAPHMPLAHLAGQRDLAAAVAATLTGGGPAVALKGRPPLPSGRVRSRAQSPELSSADEAGDSSLTQRSKRPRRAASGGVLGAVAAEASEWGLEMVSPPLKRANSLPAAAEAVPHKGGRPKVSDRVALLKKALAGETAAAAAATTAVVGVLCSAVPAVVCEAGIDELPSAEDEDAVSALFELSASLC